MRCEVSAHPILDDFLLRPLPGEVVQDGASTLEGVSQEAIGEGNARSENEGDMMLTWLLIAVLILTGWIGFQGWGSEYVENVCLARNNVLLTELREGPLQLCR